MIELTIELSPISRVKISDEDVKKVIEQAAFFNELPDRCPKCETGLIFTFRQPTSGTKKYRYYGMRCLGNPAHETSFGIHAGEGEGLFYKPGSWKLAYEARADEEDDQEQAEPVRAPAPAPAPQPTRRQPEQAPARAESPQTPGNGHERRSDGQLRMIEALCRGKKLDPHQACRDHLFLELEDINMAQAVSLIEHVKTL